MVKVSPSLLVRSTSRLCKRRENEPLNEFLGRMTHLYMDNKDIDEVKCLKSLDISGSGVNSLIGLEYFDNLERLDVESNQLADANEVLSVLTTMGHLKELNISHNPIMNEPRIRDRIIVAIGSLEFLNGKEISNSNRQFVTSWSAYKTNSEHDNQKH
uniref:LRRcap domain-containing protein n=1 Tax=Mesocestoides corti TaxID=53468 RepID=A0A5K3FCH3_MESCO